MISLAPAGVPNGMAYKNFPFLVENHQEKVKTEAYITLKFVPDKIDNQQIILYPFAAHL